MNTATLPTPSIKEIQMMDMDDLISTANTYGIALDDGDTNARQEVIDFFAAKTSPSIAEDLAASLAAIRSMSEWLTKDRDQLGRIFGNRAIIDRSIEVHSTTSHADWDEVYLNTAHATAKLLLKARDIVVIRDGVRLPYWESDLLDFESSGSRGYLRTVDLSEFCGQTDHCDLEFSAGAEDTEALCDALIAAGAREVEA